MKIAIVYNKQKKNVINLFGRPNQEKIGMKTIRRIIDALKKGKHQVIALEGDKEIINKLEEFMPRVLKGERPGIVFNVSYGIQGEARYTHVPSILEMVGIPYVASGPLAHTLALDKVVAKIIFRQAGLPTADFAVLYDPDFEPPELQYPLIVKPKTEAVSFGVKVVNNEPELREAANAIFTQYSQPVLVEHYIDGKEINVGLLGNDPPIALPPAEIVFGSGEPKIYTYEDKSGKSGRNVFVECPAKIPPEKIIEAQQLALKAFKSLECRDCARVDMRMDNNGHFYILEINSLPSIGEHGSYTQAAQAAGLDYTALVNRIVEVAVSRYFGSGKPHIPDTEPKTPGKQVFHFITDHRDQVEKRLNQWTLFPSRTWDVIGLQEARKELEEKLLEMKLKPVERFTDPPYVWTWETAKGMKDGILLVGHLDIPLDEEVPVQAFRRAPDRLYGEGIGSSRGPLVMMEYALEALRSNRLLRQVPLGVLYYLDEGMECLYSREVIQKAAAEARHVLFLRPAISAHNVITQRRGHMKYRLVVEGTPRRLGQHGKRLEVARWTSTKLEEITALSSHKDRFAIGVIDFSMERYPMRLPHRCEAEFLLSYLNPKILPKVEEKIHAILGKKGYKWYLERTSDRPPMKDKQKNRQLFDSLSEIAKQWDIPLDKKSSLWPSGAGLVPDNAGVLCGLGPVTDDVGTPHESIRRLSLFQRTLLLAQFLISQIHC